MDVELAEFFGPRFPQAKAAARNGDYQLLLGAGVNVGGHTRSGHPLPLASGLVDILRARFPDAPMPAGTSLSRAYQRALLASDETKVWELLRELFYRCRPPEFMYPLSEMPWRRVWTLNVDDVFERAYAKSLRADTVRAESISWIDPYAEGIDLQIIHLHGHVLSSDASPLVFSFSEYQGAAAQRPVWHQILQGLLTSAPIVAVGARLLDDPDMESMLMGARPSAAAPSLVVDPFITDDRIWELERLGLFVLKAPADEFSEAWAQAFSLDRASLADLYGSSRVNLPQMRELVTNVRDEEPPRHDFFGGDQPLWVDAQKNRIATFQWMNEVIGRIEEWIGGGGAECQMIIAYADRFAGLTSGLLKIGRESRSLHATVLAFDKSSRFSVERLLDFCRGRGPIVILADGAADFGNDFDEFMGKAHRDPAVKTMVVIGETNYNDLKLEGRLTGPYSREVVRVPGRLTRRDSSALIAKLEGFGRLGSLELLTPGDRVKMMANRDVFSAMLEVENAPGFGTRLDAEMRQLAPTWQLDLLLLLCLAAQGNRDISLQEATFALGVTIDELRLSVLGGGPVAALVELQGDRLVSRQRDRLLRSLITLRGEGASLAVVSSMVAGLAPLATRASLRDRTRAAVMTGHLMTCKNLTRLFPGQDLNEFYDQFLIVFGEWNGRYWEQRAIYCKQISDWPRAESYAARATSLYDDPFTRTTYGTILINRAEVFRRAGDERWFSYYERGHAELESAWSAPGARVAFFAYLESTLALLEAPDVVGDGVVQGNALEVRNEWAAIYGGLRVSLTGDSGFGSVERLEKLGRRFELLRPTDSSVGAD